MFSEKLLTICLPTFNRAIFLKKQLDNFTSIPNEYWNDIKLFISDNCSTDDTQSIGVEYSLKENVDITYSRNSENLGMDGNFVKCFKMASTKYVWLLGDDDIIKIDTLGLILNTLKNREFGLMHLGIGRKDKEPVKEYDYSDLFLKEIGIWISFISSNIVNTKYVSEIDFSKYYGSFFTLIPLYLTAIIKEKNNVMVNISIFDAGMDYGRNGGYNIAQVFTTNYLKIFKEFEQRGLVSKQTFDFERKVSYDFVIPMVYKYVLIRQKSNYIIGGTWNIIFKEYGVVSVIIGLLICFLKSSLYPLRLIHGKIDNLLAKL